MILTALWVASLGQFYLEVTDRAHFPAAVNLVSFVLFFFLGICLPLIWAASTGWNPCTTSPAHCKRHAWWFDTHLGCDYCRREIADRRMR
jgi:hypothetical protein